MERLISSTSRASPPRLLLLPRQPSRSRFASAPLPRHGFSPMASLFPKLKCPPAAPPPFDVSCVFPSPASVLSPSSCQDAGKVQKGEKLLGGTGLVGPPMQKILRSAVLAILSAVILTVIQPILAPPSYATVQLAGQSSGKFIKSELLTSAWTGFFAGCLHTLSGPDHLAALAPLSIGRTRIESALVGALWGCGHDAGQVLFGLLFLILKDRLHIEIIRTWGTRVVGMTLLAIGAMGIKEASEAHAPRVALEHGEFDVGIIENLDPASNGKKKIGFTTFATGVVHGLQPDALMIVLPALALPSRMAGAAFLVMFLLGTVFAMGSYTVFLGSCTQALKERVPRITEKLTWAASLVAISMGLALIISQYFGFNLY